MNKNTFGIVTILIVAIFMVGTVSAAGGCRGNTKNVEPYNYLSADNTIDGNNVTYILNTFNGAPSGAKVIGYCVYPEPEFTGESSDLTPSLELSAIWHPNNKEYFGFERGSGGNEIPIDGTQGIEVGIADYRSSNKLPTSEEILFHIIDGNECGVNDNDGSAESCWRKAGTPAPPVPELSPIILVSAGLLGIALIFSKYRSN